MRRRLGLLAIVCLSAYGASARSAGKPSREFAPSNSALTLPARRYELALFSNTRFGVTNELELGSTTLLLFVLPNVELKYRFFTTRHLVFAWRGRLSYPTPFLKAVSRSGGLGLLPATTHVPQALELDPDVLGSWLWAEHQVSSVWFGFAVAAHGATEELPLLDFPFLYPRFAALYTAFVPRAGLSFDGRVIGPLFYGLDFRAYLLALSQVDGAFAVEQGMSAECRFGDSVAIEIGLRTSHARYPVGLRTHFLPYLDLRFGL